MDTSWTVLIQYFMFTCATISVTRAALLTGSCDFDTNLCEWKPSSSNSKQLQWNHCTNMDGCSTGIPESTWNGSFVYVKQTNTGNGNPVAKLSSPNIRSSNLTCIFIRYYISNQNTFLKLYLQTNKSTEVWNTTNSHQRQWQETTINISIVSTPYTLVFEILKSQLTGCFGIDNLEISDKECIGSSMSPTTTSNTISLSISSLTASTTTSIIVGVTMSIGFIVGLVTLLLWFLRRSKSFCKKSVSADKTILSNDYTGHQSVALPTLPMSNNDGYTEIQATNNNYQHVKSHLNTSINTSVRNDDKHSQLQHLSDNKARNILHANDTAKHDFDETETGSAQTSMKVPCVNTLSKEIHKSSEYVVIDKNDGNDKRIKFATVPKDNYAILDPNETGFFRSKGDYASNTDYDFAVPINVNEGVSELQDPYAMSIQGMYDSTGKVYRKNVETIIYSHTVENAYDTSTYERKIVENDGTYDHFVGDKTEDNYNITKRE